MANEWIQSDGAACYDSATPGYALSQNGILTVGRLVTISFTISNMTAGKLVLDSIASKPEYTEDGDYQAVGVATSSNLTFIGEQTSSGVFDGCIDDVQSRSIPYYSIRDLSDNIIFTLDDTTGVTASGDNVQYQVDWSDIAEGCYKLTFTDGIITYESDPFYVKLSHECSIQLTWTNTEDAYGFEFEELLFTPSLRVEGRKWQPTYTKEKEVFKDSIGNRTIIRSDTSKVEILLISEVPEYVHDAIAIGIEHDTFRIDSVQYVVEDTEYSPKWRKSSQLAPSEIEVIKKDQNLVNENCG